MLNINDFQAMCQIKNIVVTHHAMKRFNERGIDIDDIVHTIQTGEIIQQYINDKPFPSCLYYYLQIKST